MSRDQSAEEGAPCPCGHPPDDHSLGDGCMHLCDCAWPNAEKDALSLLLRQAARAYLRLNEGDHWPSDVADAQAEALIAAGAPGKSDTPAERDAQRTWPENAEPTPEQLADWLQVIDRGERIRVAEEMLDNARTARACFIEHHQGLMREVSHARRDRYRYWLAWQSARRRIHTDRLLRALKEQEPQP